MQMMTNTLITKTITMIMIIIRTLMIAIIVVMTAMTKIASKKMVGILLFHNECTVRHRMVHPTNRGQGIAHTSVSLARYRGNGTATARMTPLPRRLHGHRSYGPATARMTPLSTAAIAPPSLMLPRYRGNDTAKVT